MTQWLVRYRISAIALRENPAQGVPKGHFKTPYLFLDIQDVSINYENYYHVILEVENGLRVEL
eukprot:1158208-Pelagomonas_calceolata.AAC.55